MEIGALPYRSPRTWTRRLLSFTIILFIAAISTISTTSSARAAAELLQNADTEAIMKLANEPWTGDFEAMKKRRFIRVLVSYSMTNFFIAAGRQHGFEYDLTKQYEKFLNGRTKPGRRVQMVYVPVPFDDLILALAEGRGDIIAAGMTATPERARKVQFTEPYLPAVDEIVVAHKSVKGLRNLDSLSGRNIYVVAGSSYIPSLKRVSNDLRRRGLVAIGLQIAPSEFEAEDILQLVNAGIVDMTVVDRHIAEIWSTVLPEIKLYPDIGVRKGGEIAWAIRQDSPKFLSNLNAFIARHRRGSRMGNILFKRYFEDRKWVTNPVAPNQRKKLAKYRSLFKKYAADYGFDWQLVAALAYQESGLDQSRRSDRGAVGLMQIKPSTARDKNVDIPDIKNAENNIHAGVKYLAFLRDNYFSEPDIEPEARVRLALAAYNAGPGNIEKMRAAATKAGLDPNKWFDNVARITLQLIGSQPVVYVANINKYYFAYKLAGAKLAQRKRELEALEQEKTSE